MRGSPADAALLPAAPPPGSLNDAMVFIVLTLGPSEARGLLLPPLARGKSLCVYPCWTCFVQRDNCGRAAGGGGKGGATVNEFCHCLSLYMVKNHLIQH